ncbi:glycosyltransferase [Candidatus Pelagibacter sp. Uisw_127]|uniref:glycosyltransferase family protein n=1 Tax=Candidatus Pelagibacter sp. Uisw_127 TaxID=3230988 RepID=UPI0039E848D7
MNISILLPYKENFVSNNAGAVSLFVNDITNNSIYKKTTKIFGNTVYKKFLSGNYINLNFDKNIFFSSNNQYVNSFVNYKETRNSDLIEVHNRPNYIKIIKKKYQNRLFLYFHNDPLQMSGSKTIEDRINLINNVDKIIFNSEWSRSRFFIDLDNKQDLIKKTCICFQSSSKIKINFKKKENIITFVGKLNRAKGYDLFGNAIIKILDKYNNWKSNVYGDEPREIHIFKHKNLKVSGFKDNNFILNDLKRTSISVVCSRWEEPFGRTSLEAASRGSAVIISNRGGLPETAPHAIKLKKLNSENIFKEIEALILNKKRLLSVQKKNYQNFKLTHSFVAKIIDEERKIDYHDKSIRLFNIKKKIVLKIIHATNFNRRFKGRLHYNTGRRLNNGFVRLGHNVLTLSDRDLIHENKNILDIHGKKKLQKNLIESSINFKADCLILGHADSINNETLDNIKDKNKNLKICQWFLDPISKKGPDYIKNNKRILDKIDFIDNTFLTTCPSILSKKIKNSYFMPNPSDESFEILKNYQHNCENDIFFAMSHGVHRGALKKGKFDNRELFINKLKKLNQEINFDIYGMNNVQPIWGDNFIKAISKSSMGINLSRGEPVKYYSSDRIAQLLGNGLLTFIDKKTCFNDFLSNKEIIFYNDIEDLSDKINKYKKDKKEARKIAKKGRDTYLKNFNSTIVADFILSKIFDYKSKNKFIWE